MSAWMRRERRRRMTGAMIEARSTRSIYRFSEIYCTVVNVLVEILDLWRRI
jgi:hypothetical protein